MTGDSPALSPAGCLDLLWPQVSECLVPNRLRDRLWAVADQLAPVPRIALEVRLRDDETQVDLHQLITRNEGDPAALARWLAPGDAPLAPFLADWSNDREGLQDLFPELFLEWDAPAGGVAGAPAVFLACDLRGDDDAARADRRRRVGAILKRFARALPEAAWTSAADGIEIGHVGLMVGRGTALRVNYKRVKSPQLGPLLRTLEWEGRAETACAQFAFLVDHADRVSVALDFDAGRIRPSIGFEIFMDHPLEEGPRWPRVFDRLSGLGACSSAKWTALLGVTARVRALQAGSSWPAGWIVQTALHRAAGVDPSFLSGVSHLKLTLDGEGAAAAKAYITGQHLWRRPPAALSIRRAEPLSLDEALAEMRAKAISFLLEARQQNGLWGDFNSANGGCSLWISAVAATALLGTREPNAAACARDVAARLLARQHACGGWAHNEGGPADCDTTASVLKLLMETQPPDDPRFADGVRFLERHSTPRGIPTYTLESPVVFRDGERDDSGWRAPHLCVTANCAPLVPLLSAVLVRDQLPEGCWTTYWWRTPTYAAALAVEALALAGEQDAVARAVAWASARSASVTGGFETGSVARILAAGGEAEQAMGRRLLAGLRDSQWEDGGWASDAVMFMTPPHLPAPRPDEPPIFDDRRIFTTACVLAAIAALEQADDLG